MEADGCIIILGITSRTLRTFVGCNKTYWTWPIYSLQRNMTVSDHISALHRASHVPNDTMGARRSIRVFVTRHTGSDRNFTCQIKHRVRIHKNPPCFIAYFYADCQGTKRASAYHIVPPQRPSVLLNTFPFVSNFFCMDYHASFQHQTIPLGDKHIQSNYRCS